MEFITQILERKSDGTNIVKNFFLYSKEGNIMEKAHSYFTRHQRKTAKLNHKYNKEI